MEDQLKSTNNAAITSGINLNGGQLDTSKWDRSVLLMKCPPMVSRSLHSPFSAAPSAKVIVSLDPLQPTDEFSAPATKFTMELSGTESGNVPKCYSMDMSTDFGSMSVFGESSQGKVSVEGKITNKFDLKPHNENLEDYGKLCRERTNKYMTKNRQIQVIDNDNGLRMRPMPGMFQFKGPSAPNERKKLQSKSSDMKRTRRDRGEMEEIMFKLYERQPNWTLKQLLHETDQPEQFLKDILKDLCFYNNKGANQGTYELKPEYKRSGEESESK